MRTIFLIIISFASSFLWAQSNYFDTSNSQIRIAKVLYERDGKGFYQKKENVCLSSINDITTYYAYNKKTQELFVKTKNANCVITLNRNLAKLYKKSYSVPQLKGEDLENAITKASAELEERFEQLNQMRQNQINDSIERVRRDSLKKAREDSIREETKKIEAAKYRKCHRWNWVPTAKSPLYCDLCEKSVTTNDSVLCLAIKNDSIYWVEGIDGHLNQTYLEVHVAKLSNTLKANKLFKYHNELFVDSLQLSNPNYSTKEAIVYNIKFLEEYLINLKKLAPNGFFIDWGWDSEYSSVTFNFKYMNTNKKTIKYITVYWSVTNDVGDVRKTGFFKGTGPLAEWESASWDWDYSHYYVAGDVSKMHLTKVVINYMDGTSTTIPKNKIMYD